MDKKYLKMNYRSLYQLEQGTFVNKIQQILSETGLEAKWLKFDKPLSSQNVRKYLQNYTQTRR